MFRAIREQIDTIFREDPAAKSVLEIFLCYPGFHAILLHRLAHKLYDQVTGVIGHSGWEHGGSWCRPPSPLVSVTHHDQHHRYFRCNYATHFTVWDRVMGTLHPEHDAEVRRNIAATAASRRTARLPAE